MVAKTNSAGTTTWETAYEAFGNQTASSGTTPLDRQRASTKEQDPTGLLNEGFRYRDPSTGTFLTRDPLGFIDGPNMYTYVRQNPWTHFDPEGLAAELIIRTPEEYEKVKKLKAQGDKLYEGTNLIKGFDSKGNPNAAWMNANQSGFSGVTGVTSSGEKHLYNQGKLVGTDGVWFFDNKTHFQAVKNSFAEYTWIAIGGQIGFTAVSAGFSGLGGIEAIPTNQFGSARGILTTTQTQVKAAISVPPRPLTQTTLGIAGNLQKLKGTYTVQNGVAYVRVDMIEGDISNAFNIIRNLSATAKAQGATSLRIEATLANPRLYNVLQKRYNMVTEGSNEIIIIPLK